MFRKGQIAVLLDESNPNYGRPMLITSDAGWNPKEDIADDPEWCNVIMLEGPRKGLFGCVRADQLAFYLNG